MRIYLCSDLHQAPGRYNSPFYAFAEEAQAKSDLTIVQGDSFDRARYTMAQLTSDSKTKTFAEVLNSLPNLQLLSGNHDPILAELKHLCPSAEVGERYFYSDSTVNLVCMHGWIQFDPLLTWLRPIYKRIFRYFPELAWLWDKRMTTPAKLKAQSNPEIGTYASFVYSMVMLAMKWTVEQKQDPAKPLLITSFGHSHEGGLYYFQDQIRVINTGDFLDSFSYIVITDGQPSLHWIR